jgi:REP element-mobilizing transposase RayT
MGQSLAQIYVHIIFSTQNRKPLLQDVDFRPKVHAYLAGICQNHESPALIVGGVEDHVHALCRLAKTLDVSTLLREMKRGSSIWIKQQRPAFAEFHWQDGYGAFSVSPSHVPDLKDYIANQEENHRQVSFQDEFRRICTKYGIEIDERYVWD